MSDIWSEEAANHEAPWRLQEWRQGAIAHSCLRPLFRRRSLSLRQARLHALAERRPGRRAHGRRPGV